MDLENVHADADILGEEPSSREPLLLLFPPLPRASSLGLPGPGLIPGSPCKCLPSE